MYADYIYYTTTYLGSALTEEEFARAATRASSFLDYYTRGKAKTYTGDELEMCCCALAEQYQIIENAQVSTTTRMLPLSQATIASWPERNTSAYSGVS